MQDLLKLLLSCLTVTIIIWAILIAIPMPKSWLKKTEMEFPEEKFKDKKEEENDSSKRKD